MANFGQRKKGPAARASAASAQKLHPIQTRLTTAQHQKAHAAAETLGISVSALLAELVDRMELDDHGHPGWTSRYAATVEDSQLSLSA